MPMSIAASVVCLGAAEFQLAPLPSQLQSLGLTCLLSAPSGGQGPGPVPSSVEGGYADHVGGVTCQVLQLHPELGQKQRPQALCLISELIFPKKHLENQIEKCCLECFSMGFWERRDYGYLIALDVSILSVERRGVPHHIQLRSC